MKHTAVVAFVALGLAACGGDGGALPGTDHGMDESAVEAVAPPEDRVDPARVDAPPGTDALLHRAPDGGHLVDAAGLSLYFLGDTPDGSKCDDACQDVWPPVIADVDIPVAAPGARQPMVGSLPGADGAHHVTYDGQPLYRYGGDRGAHARAGDGVEDAWGTWHLMPAEGTTP